MFDFQSGLVEILDDVIRAARAAVYNPVDSRGARHALEYGLKQIRLFAEDFFRPFLRSGFIFRGRAVLKQGADHPGHFVFVRCHAQKGVGAGFEGFFPEVAVIFRRPGAAVRQGAGAPVLRGRDEHHGRARQLRVGFQPPADPQPVGARGKPDQNDIGPDGRREFHPGFAARRRDPHRVGKSRRDQRFDAVHAVPVLDGHNFIGLFIHKIPPSAVRPKSPPAALKKGRP